MKFPAIRSHQDLGDFYIARIPVRILLDVTYVDIFRREDGELRGLQRKENDQRRQDMEDYILSGEAVFPNSIVLGANYENSGFLVETEENDTIDVMWSVERVGSSSDFFEINIPTNKSTANVIDGQHRIAGFKDLFERYKALGREDDAIFDTPFLCSVFFDLPLSEQAYIFATINSTQKKVDRNLAFELYGFDTSAPPDTWNPEKLAITLARRLGYLDDSPLHQHVEFADQDTKLRQILSQEWTVKLSVVVDGILKLITKDPKRDRNNIGVINRNMKNRGAAVMDSAPLRRIYLDSNDDLVYRIIVNYFNAVKRVLWIDANRNSYIKKSVGVQALFDYLTAAIPVLLPNGKGSLKEEVFEALLSRVRSIDFSDDYFQASGIGRSRILNVLYVLTGVKTIDNIHGNSRANLVKYLSSYGHTM